METSGRPLVLVLLIVLVAVVLSGIGQLLLKYGLNSIGAVDFQASILRAYIRIFASPVVLGGAFTYFSASLMYIYALTKFDLSFAYPLVAFGYVITALGGKLFLAEEITLQRWVGIFVICGGVYLVTRS